MEARLTNCNDKELLEKVLDAYPGIPTFAQVPKMIANRHEATKKDSKVLEPSEAFAIRNGGERDSETEMIRLRFKQSRCRGALYCQKEGHGEKPELCSPAI